METDHIVPTSEEGTDDIENAIPVCFECHAEIHSYNNDHPRGRKFTSEELKQHKQQWLDACKEQPEILLKVFRQSDVGPLQALLDELEFNMSVSNKKDIKEMGCFFLSDQFKKAIQVGSIAILKDELKHSIMAAYVSMGEANHYLAAAQNQGYESGNAWAKNINRAQELIIKSDPLIKEAIENLLKFLSSE
ncbi:MAG: HNH endonuclease [Tissierellales bacterium]|nr:HNH endonuclease [Tissierellales bacterium]